MTGEAVRLRLLLDEGVANSAGRAFEALGHEVIYGNRSLARGTPDGAVAATAIANEAILVAQDGDMHRIARGFGVDGRRFAALNLIQLACPGPDAARRVQEAMSLILHEWAAGNGRARRLHLVIGHSTMRTHR